MTEKNKAMRLADALEMSSNHGIRRDAAAELRRLHAENEELQKTKHYEASLWRLRRINADLEQQRDALLEALRLIAGLITNEEARQKALDAITKCGENT